MVRVFLVLFSVCRVKFRWNIWVYVGLTVIPLVLGFCDFPCGLPFDAFRVIVLNWQGCAILLTCRFVFIVCLMGLLVRCCCGYWFCFRLFVE